MKKLCALCLVLALLCPAALAEYSVEVGWFDGREVYKAFHAPGLTLRLNEETWRYETDNGVVWQADPIPFGMVSTEWLPWPEKAVKEMNGLYAALEDASGFWGKQVTGKGRLPVYSAPDENSWRGANGKAAVELSGGVTLMMSLGDWSMIEYQVDRNSRRIGWVKRNGLGSAPVMLTDIPVTLFEGAKLTDDPNGMRRDVETAKALTDVHLLAKLGSLWGYVSAKNAEGQTIWGFVPLTHIHLEDVADENVMAELAGEWEFASGGELLTNRFTLAADGTTSIWPQPTTWKVVGGTAGYEHDLVLNHADGRVTRLHIYARSDDSLTLALGEAGGTWQRKAE